MKLQVTQENLSKALGIVSRVADPRNSLPILANILLKAEKNRLTIAATNLEIAIVENIGGKVEAEGTTTVPARLLNDFVSSLPSGNINISLDENQLEVTSGNYQSTINGTNPEEFPAIPNIERKNALKIDSGILKKALSQTVLAASNDETRPVLTGLYFKGIDDMLTIVATDSYRLAEKKLSLKGASMLSLIPARSVQDLLRILGEGETEQVEIYQDEAQALFVVGDAELTTRLIDGQFPKYEQLLPSKHETSFVIDKQEFMTVTKVASLFAKESAGSITLNVSEKGQEVSITSIASQVGENTSRASAEVAGEGSVTLNSRFLLDALNSIDDKRVHFSFSGKLSPCILKPADDKKEQYLHVVMPLKS